MNKIDGLFSYQRQYIHWEPLKISSDNIAKANKKQIKMICTDQNGNTHEILLKYDENIKLIP